MKFSAAMNAKLYGFIVSYSCYGWGIYRVCSNAVSYGTMTMFLSLTGAVNSLVSLVPSAISLTISAGHLMDIVEMPREEIRVPAQGY